MVEACPYCNGVARREAVHQAGRNKLHAGVHEVGVACKELRNRQTCRMMAQGPSPCDPFHLSANGRVMDVEEEEQNREDEGAPGENQRGNRGRFKQ